MNKIKALSLLLISFLMFNCTEQEYPVEEQLKKDKKIIEKYAEEKALQGEYVLNDLYKVIETQPTGQVSPLPNDAVRLKFKMALLDGTIIEEDTSFYQHAQNFFITGFEAAVSTMKVGEASVFLVPSYYAYGTLSQTVTKTKVTIPPNSVIRLDLQLLDKISPKDIPQAYAFYNKLVGETTESGLFYTVMTKGTGATPQVNKDVTVKYSGYLLNDYKFESNDSFTYTLGAGNIIAGWNEVIPLLKVGDKAKVVIPSNLAYGTSAIIEAGKVKIPANAVLIFDLEILEAK